ncbi:hypothetical protein EDD99_5548 [Streptomyces sp. 846.5]|nr:hypothetical protein [Streptomyces sp. 846.5]TDT97417.1 hypothetical protein EDD99_5548 [Streptomyces sp. 846.5]
MFVNFERWQNRAALNGHLHAPRMQELVPQLPELMDSSIEDGIRFLQPFRPARQSHPRGSVNLMFTGHTLRDRLDVCRLEGPGV